MDNDTKTGIMIFEPHYKSVLWGGKRISKFKGVQIQGDTIGESWETSDIPGAESTVACGKLKGLTLSQALKKYGHAIMGERLFRRFDGKFPLLVKFIDAKQDLSIQVHPDDYIASKRHNCSGKTELWYAIDPEPGAKIYSGLKNEITPQNLAENIASGTVEALLAQFHPRRGDLYYMPSGRIHSIGAGNLILEIQQSSDITYRIFDYNRTDANGKKRQLHVDEAMEAVDYRVHEDYMRHFEPIINREIVLKECPYFTVTIINATNRLKLNIERYDSFRLLMCTHGSGYIIDPDGNSQLLNQGTTMLVPAYMSHIEIAPSSSRVEIVTAYI